MILSILTPAIISRLYTFKLLAEEIEKQIGNLPVEHLVFIDNKRRSVGLKRDALLRAARGKYVAYVDDDDWIRPDYVRSIVEAAESNPDVITFNQLATINNLSGIVEFKLGNPNDPVNPGGTTKRNAWHVCAWRRTLAMCSHFPDLSYFEDWQFASKLCALPGLTEVHIDRVLHEYRYNSKTSQAPITSLTTGIS